MYKSALADANNKTLSPGERLRRSFEIVAALYEIGEYQSGWPGISGIFLNCFEIYGENARFNSPIALYWSNWAIKVGEINQVEKFISEYREKNPGFDPALQELVLFEWQLVELRMFLAKKDYSRLEKYLRSIDREVISLDQKMSLDLLEAESFLMKEIPVEALQVISSERWVDRISADDPMASNWFVYRYWIEGVALNEIGESRRAHEVLSLAEAASVKKFGENHPNTLKILLAKTYAGLRLKGDSGPPVEINEREVQRAVEMLRLKFPINSRAVSEAVELSRMVTDGSGRGASGGVGYLVQGAPFL